MYNMYTYYVAIVFQITKPIKTNGVHIWKEFVYIGCWEILQIDIITIFYIWFCGIFHI